jgi:hypothetical protein
MAGRKKRSGFSLDTGFTVYIAPRSDLCGNNERVVRWLVDRPRNIVLLSIDPARSRGSFALRIEERTSENVRTIVLDSVFVDGGSASEDTVALPLVLQSLSRQFHERYLPLLREHTTSHPDTVLIALIEKQMQENYKLVRVQQHVMTILSEAFSFDSTMAPRFLLVEIPPRLKTVQNGVPPTIKGSALKTWSKDAAKRLLESRGDTEAVAKFLPRPRMTKKRMAEASAASDAAPLRNFKADDLADTVNQAEAFAKLVGLPCPRAEGVYEGANGGALERLAKRQRPDDEEQDS